MLGSQPLPGPDGGQIQVVKALGTDRRNGWRQLQATGSLVGTGDKEKVKAKPLAALEDLAIPLDAL